MKKIIISPSVTNWHIKNVYRYMQDISETEPISRQEEIELCKKIKQGDRKAYEDLIKSNLRFVISVAKQFQGQGLDLDDLIAEGNLGLLTAVNKFDHNANIKFISYAVWWIRYQIMYSIAKQSRVVVLPMNKINNIIKINKIIEQKEQELGREILKQDIVGDVKRKIDKITEDDFNACYESRKKSISFDSTISPEDSTTLIDNYENEEESYNTESIVLNKDMLSNIEKVLETLHVVEKDVLRWKLQLPNCPFKCLNDVLVTYKMSEKKYNYTYNRAIEKLRKKGRIKLLSE